jgi:hypothetical protein
MPVSRRFSAPTTAKCTDTRMIRTQTTAGTHRVAGNSRYHHNRWERNRNYNYKRLLQQLLLVQRRQRPQPLRDVHRLRDKFHDWYKHRDRLDGGQRLRHERDSFLHGRLHEQVRRSIQSTYPL